ncbi:alpha/beta hydrolase [Thalassovita taeanensis]|uniref:Lysophospholipase n=1 Tax=Thalassovita taeanensis TaxID=657014 RepID=A0A1H9KKI7_9RHOB|nr:alpha/beta hydrolase [Thalassovita taeanensis]SEQ99660.1 lysophospholipase [Thalassovita taeanensis]
MQHEAPFLSDIANGAPDGRAFWLTTDDQVKIRVGVWNAQAGKGTVLLFPGRTEYIEKYAHAAADLSEAGYATLAIDWRGQGLADRLIDDPMIGHVAQFRDYQHDVAAALRAAQDMDLPQPWFLIAHSMGGGIGLRSLQEGLPVRGCVFTGPMWGILLAGGLRPVAWTLTRVSRMLGIGATLSPGTRGTAYVTSEPFEDNTLTTDPTMYAFMQEQLNRHPELSLGGPSMNWLHEALLDTRSIAQRPSPALPCLTYLGGNERIVDAARIRDRMAAWPDGNLIEVPGAEHEVLMETPAIRNQVMAEIIGFFATHGTTAQPSTPDGSERRTA